MYVNALRFQRITTLEVVGHALREEHWPIAKLVVPMLLNSTGQYPDVTTLSIVDVPRTVSFAPVLGLLPRSNVRRLITSLTENDIVGGEVENVLRNGWVKELCIFCRAFGPHFEGLINTVCRTPADKSITLLNMCLRSIDLDALGHAIASLSDPRATHRLRTISLNICDTNYGRDAVPWPDQANPMHLLTIPSLQYLCVSGWISVVPALVASPVLGNCLRRRMQSGAPPLTELRLMVDRESEEQAAFNAEGVRALVAELSPTTRFVAGP